MLLLLRVLILAICYLYFFRESFIAELAISFIPYIIGFCILAIFIEIFLILKESRRRRKNKIIRIFLSIILTALTIGIGTLYTSEFFSFYNQPDNSIRLENNEGIKVFYANILYKNTDYESLKQKIEKEDPDIVVMVEFSDEHEEEMKEFFKENYPYMNRNSWSMMLAGDVVFSKIPLNNVTTTGLSEKGSWKYSYMQIDCENVIPQCKDKIDLYVVHTAAPISIKNFEMRNTQLTLFGFHLQNEITTPTIVIGDFNLSPWSHYYQQLTENWSLLNALSFQSPNYTRSLLQQGIFRSHIDQLFISKDIKISQVNIENLAGSDHRSFLFNFGIKD